MTSASVQPDSSGPISLEGELTIYTAAESFDRLGAALEGRNHCELDLSGVTEIDSAGLQLILWTKQTCEARGASFSLVGQSEAVTEAMTLLHLAHRFGIDSPHEAEDGAA